jgi:uncharacterized damage-inducible protein DinB
MLAENVQLRPSRYPRHGREPAEGYDAVLDSLARMHDESLAIFISLTDEDLQKHCVTPDGTRLTVWKWLRAMIEHEVHHRGQLYIYLTMIGIAAPPSMV